MWVRVDAWGEAHFPKALWNVQEGGKSQEGYVGFLPSTFPFQQTVKLGFAD